VLEGDAEIGMAGATKRAMLASPAAISARAVVEWLVG
jgi:hypothetical protein